MVRTTTDWSKLAARQETAPRVTKIETRTDSPVGRKRASTPRRRPVAPTPPASMTEERKLAAYRLSKDALDALEDAVYAARKRGQRLTKEQAVEAAILKVYGRRK